MQGVGATIGLVLPDRPIPFPVHFAEDRSAECVLPPSSALVSSPNAAHGLWRLLPGGRIHKDTVVGCIVLSVTASSSTARVSRSTWSQAGAVGLDGLGRAVLPAVEASVNTGLDATADRPEQGGHGQGGAGHRP
jgi:hypothetical protein